MNQEITNNSEIGKRIRAIRTKHKLTQEEMADILGIHSTPHYQNIEYGKSRVTIEQLQLLNEKFGASPNFVLLGEVANEEEYIYDFLTRSPEEKIKIFIEIARQAFGEKQSDFEANTEDK